MEKEKLLYSIDDILETFDKKCALLDSKEKEKKKTLPGYTLVDLGLPSGTLWATENARGFYDYESAINSFGDNLPSMMQAAELASYCSWVWNKNGYIVSGPNRNSIFLPVTGAISNFSGGNRKADYKDTGFYWVRRECKDEKDVLNSQANAYNLSFYSGGVSPLYNYYRASGFAVRPAVI